MVLLSVAVVVVVRVRYKEERHQVALKCMFQPFIRRDRGSFDFNFILAQATATTIVCVSLFLNFTVSIGY